APALAGSRDAIVTTAPRCAKAFAAAATRLTDGKRKIVSIQELTGMEGDIINMQGIFTFKRTGMNGDGSVRGYFCATGVRPKFAERLQAFGINLPDSLYDPAQRYETK
ncbi:hypothetical protein SB861_56855, partial [Paraburkholderia sp. SIMBA_049]